MDHEHSDRRLAGAGRREGLLRVDQELVGTRIHHGVRAERRDFRHYPELLLMLRNRRKAAIKLNSVPAKTLFRDEKMFVFEKRRLIYFFICQLMDPVRY